MAKAGQNDNQKRFPEFKRQHSHGGDEADPGRRRSAARVLRVLFPAGFAFLAGQAPDTAPVKANKLAKGAHTPTFPASPIRSRSRPDVNEVHRGLPEQSLDERFRG